MGLFPDTLTCIVMEFDPFIKHGNITAVADNDKDHMWNRSFYPHLVDITVIDS